MFFSPTPASALRFGTCEVSKNFTNTFNDSKRFYHEPTTVLGYSVCTILCTLKLPCYIILKMHTTYLHTLDW